LAKKDEREADREERNLHRYCINKNAIKSAK